MIKSMTGFGRGEYADVKFKFAVEIKTVNHRYTDCSIRMSRRLNFIEDKAREYILKNVSRGKIDVSIQFEDFSEGAREVELDEALASAYVDSLKKMKEKYNLIDDISVSTIASYPEVLKVQKGELEEDEVWKALSQCINIAITSLVKMREIEGAELKKVLIERIDNIAQMHAIIIEKAPEVVLSYKAKLEDRIKELLDRQIVDESRLATEVVFFADRCNIDEEIDRLNSHIEQFRNILNSNQPIGRKLDFMVQEMNREVNTIGSKTSDIKTLNQVVDLKSEMEKIREQIQNIE